MNSTLEIARAFDFAARSHVRQRRKGDAGEPYINHLAEVAALVAEATAGEDPVLIVGALLHDAVEDQDVTLAELQAAFGADVAALVAEVTDDKSLPSERRKQLQIETTPAKSARAKLLKLADLTSNLRSLGASPPNWPLERQRDYVAWAERVAAGCAGANLFLERAYGVARAAALAAIARRGG